MNIKSAARLGRSRARRISSLPLRNSLVASLLLLAGLALLPAGAFSVFVGAQFESPEYWDSHAIYLARVTDIRGPSPANDSYVTSFMPAKIISGSVDPTNRTVRSRLGLNMLGGMVGEQPKNFPLGVAVGDSILASESSKYRQTTIVRVMKYPDDQSFQESLARIAGWHRNPVLPALLAGSSSRSDLESEYCLNSLLLLPAQTIAETDTQRLQGLADDEHRPARLRIVAEKVALRFSGLAEAGRDEAEYRWLKGIIDNAAKTPASGDPQEYQERLRAIFMEWFENKNHWPDTVDYILRLLSDPAATAETRQAACSVLGNWDQKVFNFPRPDKLFDRMFDTYAGLLKDPDPDLRISGADMLLGRTLNVMAMHSPPELTQEHGGRAVQLVRQALAVETDSHVKYLLQSRLDIYQMKKDHPFHWPDGALRMRQAEINTANSNAAARH